MRENADDRIQVMLDSVYRAESGRILATLIRLLGVNRGQDIIYYI
jgi:hypothetical protein